MLTSPSVPTSSVGIKIIDTEVYIAAVEIKITYRVDIKILKSILMSNPESCTLRRVFLTFYTSNRTNFQIQLPSYRHISENAVFSH